MMINDTISTDSHAIRDHIIHFYAFLFMAPPSANSDFSLVDSVVHPVVANMLLVREPMPAEVRDVVFDRRKVSRSPGVW